MKLKVLAVSLLAFAGFSASATAATPLVAPQPLSPASGTRYYIESTTQAKAVILSASIGTGQDEFEWAEASLSSTTNPDGSFADPLAFEGAGRATHSPTVEEYGIPVFEFGPGGDLYNGSPEATVYWHPYVDGCEELPHEYIPGYVGTELKCDIKKYGAMWTFVYTTTRPPPESEVGRSGPDASCRTWLNIDKSRLTSAREAARKFNHAKTHGERNYWHAQLVRRARSLREAHQKMLLFCS